LNKHSIDQIMGDFTPKLWSRLPWLPSLFYQP
jgi:hypothetical protein